MQFNGTPQSQAAFIQWLRSHHPRLYAVALQQPETLGSFSDAWNKITGTISNILEKGAEILPTYVQTKQQLELLRLNIARAKQGMMPVNALPEASSAVVATQPPTSAGSFMDSLPPWAIPVALGAVLFLLLRR